MLFHTFSSQEERRAFGGSYFIELQKAAPHLKVGEIHPMQFWKNDSLYIYGDDDNAFFDAYHKIFINGIYANGQTGVMDVCGINYYSGEETARIVKELKQRHLPDQDTLIHWLETPSTEYGLWILGL